MVYPNSQRRTTTSITVEIGEYGPIWRHHGGVESNSDIVSDMTMMTRLLSHVTFHTSCSVSTFSTRMPILDLQPRLTACLIDILGYTDTIDVHPQQTVRAAAPCLLFGTCSCVQQQPRVTPHRLTDTPWYPCLSNPCIRVCYDALRRCPSICTTRSVRSPL